MVIGGLDIVFNEKAEKKQKTEDVKAEKKRKLDVMNENLRIKEAKRQKVDKDVHEARKKAIKDELMIDTNDNLKKKNRTKRKRFDFKDSD